ncbi:MAG: TlpA disulfide reductase family protein [Sphingobacteriaceae bacterium]
MTIRISSILSFLLIGFVAFSQQVSAVYKIDDLLKRIDNGSDTIYVVNFWATWCKPCVQELPEFEAFSKAHAKEKVKVLLVSLDFKEEKNKKVNPFLQKNNYKTECVLLDEVNGNDFIDKIDKRWTGARPATFITLKKRTQTFFEEKKIHQAELEAVLKGFQGR